VPIFQFVNRRIYELMLGFWSPKFGTGVTSQITGMGKVTKAPEARRYI
jgi:hypothetical protein